MKENFLFLIFVFIILPAFASPAKIAKKDKGQNNHAMTHTPPGLLFKKITGSVSTADGTPLPGASITAPLTDKTAISDDKGRFVIEVENHEEVLIFSFAGMKTQEITIKNRSIINVELKLVAAQLTDVIVTGMQRREKNKMIGAISTVTAKDIENAGVTTIDKALKGKMPGVYVRSTSGRPGEVGEIIIHGTNTMTGNKEPLYVLDGMPMQSGEVSGGVNSLLTNGLGNIPPDDIESISILKDATAASIYGARAANGVIIITTKQGQAGKDYVSYTGKAGITFRPENKFSFMNSAEKLDFERGIYEDFHPVYGGRVNQLLYQADNGVITHTEAEANIAELAKTNTDWIKEIFRPAMLQSHNLTLSGGNLKTQYNVSLNYQNSEGTLVGNKYQMGGLNMKLSRYITDKFLVRVNLYSTLKSNEEGQSLLDPFRYASFANPYEKPYNADGTYAADMTYRNLDNDITYYSDLNYKDFNILRELKENTLKSFYGNVRGQLGLEYSFLRNFRYTGTAVVDYTSIHNQDESRAGTYRSWASNWLNAASTQNGMVLPQFNQGFLREDMGRSMNYTVRNSIEYNNNFGKHFVQLFGANEFGGKTNNQFNHYNPVFLQDYRVTGYPSWNFITTDRFNKLDLSKFGGTKFEEDRSVSFIGSGVYSYDNRYVFNANIRTDGVDIIGTQNQFAPLWSAGVRWNAHNESFLKPYNDILSRLVLSAGFGYRGSINRSVYPFHTYALSALTYDGIIKATNFNYGNPVLKWERKKDINLGMELSLYKGRVNLEARYFNEKVTDLLDLVQLPVSVGRQSATVNVGALSNKGLELSARFEVIKTKDLLWEVGANYTTVKNNLDNVYYNLLPSLAQSKTYNIEDYSINSWFGYKFDHVNQDNGHMMVKALKLDTKVDGNQVINTYTEEVIDLNTISSADLQAKYRTFYLGHKDPEYYGGFNTRVSYKAFELATNFVYAGGNTILSFQDRKEGPNALNNVLVNDVTASRTNRTKEQLNRWRNPGDITNVPVYGRNVNNYTSYLLDSDLEDGSFLKCTELALSWRAQSSMLAKGPVKTLKASIIANNLFTISNYSGTDPETQTTFGYPTTKSITVLLNIGF